ncbi:MAG: RNA-binding S4 domain-containing protein [Rhodospirillales bacterium]|nr:RNA-binding S4 domain-containing protein [Rhodospirillales bacterium]
MSEPQRLDHWLVVARFAKTRALAQELIARGRIKRNGQKVEKPAQPVKPGDVLILPRGRDLLVVEVLGTAERRGPAAQARLLYRDLEQTP